MASCLWNPPLVNTNDKLRAQHALATDRVSHVGAMTYRTTGGWWDSLPDAPLKYEPNGRKDRYYNASVRTHPSLTSTLYDWAKNLNWYAANSEVGQLRWIGHAGTLRYYTSNAPSYHYPGQAMDINRIDFQNHHVDAFNATWVGDKGIDHWMERHRYQAVEASLRKYFGYVLNYRMEGHHNHWHVDNAGGSCTPGYHGVWYTDKSKAFNNSSLSVVYFIQNTVNAFIGYEGRDYYIQNVDGLFGSRTQRGFDYLLDRMNLGCIDPLRNTNEWRWFLDNVIWLGLNHKNAGWKRGWC